MRRGGLSRREELYPEAGSLISYPIIIGRTEKNFTERRQRKARRSWPYGHSHPLRDAYLLRASRAGGFEPPSGVDRSRVNVYQFRHTLPVGREGLEPSSHRLKGACSAIELASQVELSAPSIVGGVDISQVTGRPASHAVFLSSDLASRRRPIVQSWSGALRSAPSLRGPWIHPSTCQDADWIRTSVGCKPETVLQTAT